MASQSNESVLRGLLRLSAGQALRSLPDCELLERFVEAHDEAAFTALIERHGPMVLGVCRRTLPSFHDAEDASQATFLVLARKANAIRKKASLGSWLHGVACRSAAKLKRNHARRTMRERGVQAPVQRDPVTELGWREAEAILDGELQRLPERYRAPLILCYLECRTRDEASKQLGLSSGSLHGRLERARSMLRKRLTQRGLSLSAVLSATLIGDSVSHASLAPKLVAASTQAGLLLVAGQPLAKCGVATPVISLTREVLKSMLLTKVKLGTLAVLCTGFVVALFGRSITSSGIAQEGKSTKAGNQNRVDLTVGSDQVENDKDFIRRISKDLRGNAPTPAEVHFFVTSTEAGKRQTLIDLFIQERQAKSAAADAGSALLRQLRPLESQYLEPILPLHSSLTLPTNDLWPTKAEVLHSLPEATRAKKPSYNCLLVEHTFDLPRLYPLVGIAQLEHARFKCTIITNDSSDVVYIDHNRLVPAERPVGR